MREIIELIKHKIKHILTSHCDECIALEDERWKRDHTCTNCENLLMLLEQSRSDYRGLLENMINPPKQVETRPEHEFQPIIRKAIPWNLRRHMLEVEDRKKAQTLSKKQSVEELEKKLLGEKDETETQGNAS